MMLTYIYITLPHSSLQALLSLNSLFYFKKNHWREPVLKKKHNQTSQLSSQSQKSKSNNSQINKTNNVKNKSNQ